MEFWLRKFFGLADITKETVSNIIGVDDIHNDDVEFLYLLLCYEIYQYPDKYTFKDLNKKEKYFIHQTRWVFANMENNLELKYSMTELWDRS